MRDKLEKINPYLNDAMLNGVIAETPMEAPIVTDPNGSYTGRPKDPNDKPIQDADDL